MTARSRQSTKHKRAAKKKKASGGFFIDILPWNVAGGLGHAMDQTALKSPGLSFKTTGGDIGSGIGDVTSGVSNVGKAVSDPGGAIASGFKAVLIDPVVGDFKKNRGKWIIGLAAGFVLIGSAIKVVSGSSNVRDIAAAAVAPEAEGLRVAGSGAKAGLTTRLQAREPIVPIRAAMRKYNP